mgnify:CR=1 FL=1
MKDIYISFNSVSRDFAWRSMCNFLCKNSLSDSVERSLTGFAAGVMIAASVWSLLIPAIEQSENMGEMVVYSGSDRILGRGTFFCCY